MPGKIIRWPEPSLLFVRGQAQRIVNPKEGLASLHPYDLNYGQRSFDTVKLSIIHDGQNFDQIKRLMNQMKEKHSPTTRTSAIPYPGFAEIYKANLALPTEISECVELRFSEIEEIRSTSDLASFKAKFSSVMTQKLQDVLDKLGRADAVVFIQLPNTLVSKFDLLNVRGYGLRDMIKAVGVRKGVKTQVLTSNALSPFDMADDMWNLSLSSYVQAGGRPWRMREIPPSSIFMGIAYGIKEEEREMEAGTGQRIVTGFAELFDTYGEHLDIAALDFESGDYVVDAYTKSLYLTYEAMNRLVKKAMQHYGERYRGDSPLSVTIHKTTDFKDDEKKAVKDAIGTSASVDMVHIVTNPTARILGDSQPIHRGCFYKEENETNSGLLYTTGFMDEEGTYQESEVLLL